MKAKKRNENYSTVCWYCGVIFKNNRSSGRFCPDSGHRQLYDKYGPRIDPIVITKENTYQNADESLYAAYRVSQNRRPLKSAPGGWDDGLEESELVERFGYRGPLPQGDVLLVVGSYVLKGRTVLYQMQEGYRLFIKPITALTIEERARERFISARDAENGAVSQVEGPYNEESDESEAAVFGDRATNQE